MLWIVLSLRLKTVLLCLSCLHQQETLLFQRQALNTRFDIMSLVTVAMSTQQGFDAHISDPVTKTALSNLVCFIDRS